MVGWSRRSRESDERRARWWASLTNEEREMATFLSEVNEPRDAFLLFKVFVIMWFVIALVALFK